MIFVDTSFWVAVRNRRDQWHRVAVELLSRYGTHALITSNHVRGETWTYLRRKAGHRAAVDFLAALDSSKHIEVVFVDAAHDVAAVEWLKRHDEREYSYVDATSFALMRAIRVTEALAFDGDFGAAGFVELRP